MEERDGGQVQAHDDDVHNVREGRSPAQFQGQLGAHASTRQRGDRDLEERKGQNPQALGRNSRAQVQNPVSRCW